MDYSKLLISLKRAHGTTNKLELLAQADECGKLILQFTYNPFLRYQIDTRLPKYKVNKYGRFLDEDPLWAETLTKVHKRELTGFSARDAIVRMLEVYNEESAEWILKILKKNLALGINVKTINKVFPGLIPDFGVMLAQKWDSSYLSKPLLMSIKYDGVRAIFKDGKLLTRRGHQLIGLDHITSILNPDISVDGELIIPGVHFQEASGKIRSGQDVPEAVYMVFDYLETMSDPMHERYKNLISYVEQVGDPYVKLVKHIPVKNEEHIHTTFKKVLDQGYEGLMIKLKNAPYVYVRSSNWLKLKVQDTLDLAIIDSFEGKDKYEGMLGGFIVNHKGVSVKVGSGFSDEDRVNYWRQPEQYVGQVIEVAYHEETPDHSLRHPVYKGFRWDK